MVSWNGTKVVFLEVLLTLSNVNKKVGVFELIESRKLRVNVDESFGLRRFFSCINIPNKFLT